MESFSKEQRQLIQQKDNHIALLEQDFRHRCSRLFPSLVISTEVEGVNSLLDTVEVAVSVARREPLHLLDLEHLVATEDNISRPNLPLRLPLFGESINHQHSEQSLSLPLGSQWSTFGFQLRKLRQSAAHLNDVGKQSNDTVRVPQPTLREKDMDMFGYSPQVDPLVLVKCIYCSKAIKASRFARHLEYCTRTPDLESFGLEDTAKSKKRSEVVTEVKVPSPPPPVPVEHPPAEVKPKKPTKEKKRKADDRKKEKKREKKKRHSKVPTLAEQCLKTLPAQATQALVAKVKKSNHGADPKVKKEKKSKEGRIVGLSGVPIYNGIPVNGNVSISTLEQHRQSLVASGDKVNPVYVVHGKQEHLQHLQLSYGQSQQRLDGKARSGDPKTLSQSVTTIVYPQDAQVQDYRQVPSAPKQLHTLSVSQQGYQPSFSSEQQARPEAIALDQTKFGGFATERKVEAPNFGSQIMQSTVIHRNIITPKAQFSTVNPVTAITQPVEQLDQQAKFAQNGTQVTRLNPTPEKKEWHKFTINPTTQPNQLQSYYIINNQPQ